MPAPISTEVIVVVAASPAPSLHFIIRKMTRVIFLVGYHLELDQKPVFDSLQIRIIAAMTFISNE
jgi:hypothetical protein